MAIFSACSNQMVVSAKWDGFYNSICESTFPPLAIYKDYDDPVQFLTDMWINREMMQTSVWLTPRDIINKAGLWDESLMINQDGEYFCRVLLHSDGIHFSDGKVFYRLGLANSVSRSGGSYIKASSLLQSYLLCEKHLSGYLERNEVGRALSINYYSFIYIYYHLYPDLVKQAIKKVKTLAIPPPKSKIGGVNFRELIKYFGFFNVLRMRNAIHSVKKVF